MATLQYIYTDATLTTLYDTDTPLELAAADGQYADGVIYVGVPDANRKLQDADNPNTSQIQVSVTDSDGATAPDDLDIKLALTNGGLASASGGASLNLGLEILGGAGNAVAVHIRYTNSEFVGTSTDVGLLLSSMIEVAV